MAPTLMIFPTLMAPMLWPKHKMFPTITKISVKLAFYISLTFLLLNCSTHPWATNFCFSWLTLPAMYIPLTMQFDLNATLFMTVAFYVSSNILEYSSWYMKSDQNLNIFMKYLLIFLIAMIILVSANNLPTLFIGWEGVGIMSYLLIGWYHGRNDAVSAAVQAVLYNRMGDIGFLLASCWALKTFGLTNLDTIPSLSPPPTLVLIALITAAATKSAQFGFHPWLASAMEGPTPVSALLHSSTMVVAGIYLMIQISPMLLHNQIATTTCLYLGALSTFYASTSALLQNDIKKIIAYSTSSQLGLMMVAIGIGQPHFALFHICTHAFFKAMLFLCSGLFIHNLNDEQDIRKMGGLHRFFPVTTTCFSIGTFALMGTPFLSAFYSKDAIIESINTSHVNLTALLLTLVATMFTATYSVRLIYFISLHHTRTYYTTPSPEHNSMATKPVLHLTCGSTVTGLFIFYMLIPNTPVTHTMSMNIKLTALAMTIIAFLFTFALAKMTWTNFPPKSTSPNLLDPLLFNQTTHRWWTQSILNTAGQTISFLIESIMLNKMTTILPYAQKLMLRRTQTAQLGLIKAYLSTLLVTLTLSLTLMVLL